jgi:hypothetical protein
MVAQISRKECLYKWIEDVCPTKLEDKNMFMYMFFKDEYNSQQDYLDWGGQHLINDRIAGRVDEDVYYEYMWHCSKSIFSEIYEDITNDINWRNNDEQ